MGLVATSLDSTAVNDQTRHDKAFQVTVTGIALQTEVKRDNQWLKPLINL